MHILKKYDIYIGVVLGKNILFQQKFESTVGDIMEIVEEIQTKEDINSEKIELNKIVQDEKKTINNGSKGNKTEV